MHGRADDPAVAKFRTKPGAGSRMEARGMTDKGEWFVWNGSLGVLDSVTIGAIEHGAGGRSAFLAPPYDIVGPFSLDELETRAGSPLAHVWSCRARDGGRIRSNCAARGRKNVALCCFGWILAATSGTAARH